MPLLPGCLRHEIIEHLVDPRSRRIDEQAGRGVLRGAGFAVAQGHGPDAALAPGRCDPCPRLQHRAAVGGIAGIENHQAGIIDPAVGIFERLGISRPQSRANRISGKIDRRRARQPLAAAQVVVDEQAEAQEPGRP